MARVWGDEHLLNRRPDDDGYVLLLQVLVRIVVQAREQRVDDQFDILPLRLPAELRQFRVKVVIRGCGAVPRCSVSERP